MYLCRNAGQGLNTEGRSLRADSEIRLKNNTGEHCNRNQIKIVMVNIGGSRELASIVDGFRQQVINDVIQYRIAHHTSWSKSADEKDYPKVITGCEYSNVREAGRSERGRCCTPRSPQLHPLVLNPIISIAPDWKGIPYSKGKMHYGTCAEDDAATKVLYDFERNRKSLPYVKDLVFAQPIRPRTLETVDCCEVCEHVFG